MTRVRVASFSVSLEGFGAGPRQDAEHPLGIGGGKRFLPDGVHLDLRLVGQRRFASGVLALRYVLR